MDFLIEPLIDTDTNSLIVDDAAAPCCVSGSGCGQGMAQNTELEEL